MNRTSPTQRVNVEIFDGNTLIGTSTANQFRQDLHNLGLGDGSGNYGFSFPTPASMRDGRSHTIRVRGAGAYSYLGNVKVFNSNCGSSPTALIRLFGGGQSGNGQPPLNFLVSAGQSIRVTFDATTSQISNTAIRFWNWTRQTIRFRPDGSLVRNDNKEYAGFR